MDRRNLPAIVAFVVLITAFAGYGQKNQILGLGAVGKCYIFSSFRDNGEDGLHLSYSTDGYNWTALNNDKSFMTPMVGK